MDNHYTLLNMADGEPFTVTNPNGASPVLLICEHASSTIPEALANLGLDAPAAKSHVAWDPGAMAVSEALSQSLNATLISARFSRLVYDCNRPPEATGAMPSKSEVFLVPGNRDIPPEQRAARIHEIYEPFVSAIKAEISKRSATVLVTIHSFTPIYYGEKRKVELGILHDQDATFADAILNASTTLNMHRNQPYGPADGVTHTLKLHALPNNLLNVMIEIRNDLIATPDDQRKVADELSSMIIQALETLQVEASHA